MPATTRKTRKQGQKRAAGQKQREVKESRNPSVPKRILTSQPATKKPRVEEPILISSATPLSPPMQPIEPQDIPDEEFTINMSVILGTATIHRGAWIAKLGVWEFRKSFKEAVEKVSKEAAKAKIGFEWDKGEATISAKGIAKDRWLHPEVEDEEGWTKVESMVSRWMGSPKVSDINVNLSLVYKRTQLSSDTLEIEDTTGKKVHHLTRI